MSTIWHPYTSPPEPLTWVILRFGDDGERDTRGFYRGRDNSFYASVEAMWQGRSVHPTHWAEIKAVDNRE